MKALKSMYVSTFSMTLLFFPINHANANILMNFLNVKLNSYLTRIDTDSMLEPKSTDRQSNTIIIDNGFSGTLIDPHKISGKNEFNIVRQLFVGLTTTDENGKTVAGMATQWETKDNITWTFHLRDANWSNGKPVIAEDFVYSFQRFVNPETESPYASYLSDAQVVNANAIINGEQTKDKLGITAIDDKTLQIRLNQPLSYLPDLLVSPAMSPVHKETIQQYEENWTAPENIVVNGAYNVSKTEDKKITLKRNPHYYDDENTQINQAILISDITPDERIQMYQNNQLDITENNGDNFYDDVFESDKQLKPILCTYYYEMNMQKPPFDDVNVRRALALTLDRELITETVMKTHQTPAYQFTPPSTNGNVKVTPDWQSWNDSKRLEMAKKLLIKAGYNEDNPLEFELLYNTHESHKKIAKVVKEMWQSNLNVNIHLVNKEWKSFLQTRIDGTYQMSRAGWCADYNEPSAFLNTLKSDSAQNHGKYRSTEFDAIMARAQNVKISSQERTNLYNQAEQLIERDVPFINIYHYGSAVAVKPYVMGYSLTDGLWNWQIKDMWLDSSDHNKKQPK